MIHQIREYVKTERGFTLIELLIVIAIIAILTVAFLPGALKAPARARDAGRIKAVADIQASIEGYIAGHSGAYPATAAGGQVDASVQLALGINAPYSAAPTANSTYYYFKEAGATPTFYAVGFVPENTGNVNSQAVVADFLPAATRTKVYLTTAPATVAATNMYVVAGPI